MVSEKDLEDWDRGPVTKLYNVKPRTYIECPWSGTVLFFDHIDGMYSFCTDMNGAVVHLQAFAEVLPLAKKDINENV